MATFLQILSSNKKDFALAIIALLIFLLSIPIVTYAYFAKDLTTKESIMNKNDTGITLFDNTGKPFFTFYHAKNKDFIPLSKIPIYVQQAIIISEDKEFYHHPGFSARGIARSVLMNIKQGNIVSGGSTITQQLVKNVLLSPQKNFMRKYQELILAQEIERRYSKQEILEMYLNSVYFGEGAFGIEEAARTYFAKQANELTLAEASLLAALLPSPSQLSPITGEKDKAFKRQKTILQEMREAGYISEKLEKTALNEKIVFNQPDDSVNEHAPHFALMVRNELIKRYGEETIARSGFKVSTTLNLEWQIYAEKIVRNQVDKLAVNRVTNGGAIVIEPQTGAVRVVVGSKNWYDNGFGKFNVTTALRQPGSAFKPIVYAAALEDNIVTPATILHDQPTTFPLNYKPKNYDGKFRGPVTVRRALANSLNVPSVELMNKVGINNALEMAHRLGITSLEDPTNYGLSLVLGAGEVSLLDLTTSYATLANKGIRNKPFIISYIEDKRNQKIYQHQPTPERVIDERYAFLISSILSDNKTRAEVFGNALNTSRQAAVKTGTSEDFRDSWTIGYTPSLAIGAWVGNNDNTPMDNIAGSLGAAPIWRALMEQFLQGTHIETFYVPDGIVSLTTCGIDERTDNVASSSAIIVEYFVQGTEPSRSCNTPTTASSTTPTLSPSPFTTAIPTTTSPTQILTPSPPLPTDKQPAEEKNKNAENTQNKKSNKGKH